MEKARELYGAQPACQLETLLCLTVRDYIKYYPMRKTGLPTPGA